MKFVCNCMWPNGKNILADMFKISIQYTNLETRQIQSRQNMKVFPKCLKNQCWKELKLLDEKVKSLDGIWPCIKQPHIFVIKHHVMCFSSDLILEGYCEESYAYLAPKLGARCFIFKACSIQ